MLKIVDLQTEYRSNPIGLDEKEPAFSWKLRSDGRNVRQHACRIRVTRDGRVTFDAAFMDGQCLRLGAVMSVENVANPIRLARMLCGRETNCVLAGRGAEQAAVAFGLPMRDMRTQASMKRWQAERAGMPEHLTAYTGHDTVCVLALDDHGGMAAGTSTSGLFLKEPGRVGDSPIVGSGFYCDARFGAAAATGLGEDIMRGCLSYETVSLMKRGLHPKQACEEALRGLAERKLALGENAGSISLIALSPDGSFGAATTLPCFPFAAGSKNAVGLFTAAADSSPLKVVTEKELEGID